MEDNIALAQINKAQIALEAANDIHEILDIRDKAQAIQIFANAQGFKEAAQEAKIFQLKAERKAGGWLAEHVDHGGDRRSRFHDETLIVELPDGIDKNESHRWQLEASVPDETFNDWIDEKLSTGSEISAAGLIREAKKGIRQVEIDQLIAIVESNLYTPPTGLFNVIVIDPPWPYGTPYDSDGRRAANPYPEMSLDEISLIKLPAADDCILWLWTTHKFMRHAFSILDNWSFRDVAILTWEKDTFGLGSWLRSNSEFCIMAVKGHPIVNLTNQTTVIHGPMREHSRKPDEFYAMVNILCPGYKLDWFAREVRDGWTVFGIESEKFNG